MKVHIELDMTPEEARKLMGLPDVSAMQERMMAEVERRMKAAVDGSDPEAMLKAWMPLQNYGQGFEQFQQFLWDAARGAATGTAARKPAPKR
jgi:4'-phosphopantetheinyl transferase EntD